VVSVCMQGRARASMNFEPMAEEPVRLEIEIEEPIRHNHGSDDPGHQAQSIVHHDSHHLHSAATQRPSGAITSTQRPSAGPLIMALRTAKRSRCFASLEM
jgi:hypothetical protein